MMEEKSSKNRVLLIKNCYLRLKRNKIVNKNITTVICDIICNVSWTEVSVSFILSLIIMCLKNENLNFSIDDILNVSITLLGFQLAAYAILFGLGNVNKKLTQKAKNGYKPFEVLHATFVFGMCINALVVIFSLLQIIPNCCNLEICVCGAIFSLIWIVNIVFHLYATRTFIQ